MAYTAYENTSGEVLSQVASLSRHLTDSGAFTTSTQPSLEMVESWITEGYYFVAARLASNGLAVTQTGTEVLGVLQQINVLEAVIKVELSHPVTTRGEPNERFMAFMAQRDAIVELLSSGALEALGATTSTATDSQIVAASGISWAEKVALANDSDHITHRFRRGQFRNTGARDPRVVEDTRLE